MSTRIARALELAAQLEGAELPAYIDPAEALANLPAILIRPPSVSYDDGTIAGPLVSWSLTVIASTPDQFAAWQELDPLLDSLAAVLDIGRVDPASYAQPDSDLLPCYVATYQEALESA